MSQVNVYEILDQVENAPDDTTRINILRYNQTPALKDVLLGAFNPYIKFVIKEIPEYKCEDMPPGMSYGNMATALDKSYLFIEGHPRTPPNLTYERKIQLLQQQLESLESKEAEVFANMILKDLKVKGLTKELVNEAFPDIPL
jgi:hypothetical protein